MGRRTLLASVAVLVGLLVWLAIPRGDGRSVDPPVVTQQTERSASAAPSSRDPVFTPRGEAFEGIDDDWKPMRLTAQRATELEDLAMHAVYDRCSQFAVFREGSRLRADIQFNKRWFSNVEVDIANPAKADGNTLWYTVFFQQERPVSFKATKGVAARLCGLPGKDAEVNL